MTKYLSKGMKKINIKVYKNAIHKIFEDPKKRKIVEELILQAIIEYTKKRLVEKGV